MGNGGSKLHDRETMLCEAAQEFFGRLGTLNRMSLVVVRAIVALPRTSGACLKAYAGFR